MVLDSERNNDGVVGGERLVDMIEEVVRESISGVLDWGVAVDEGVGVGEEEGRGVETGEGVELGEGVGVFAPGSRIGMNSVQERDI